MVAPEPFFEPRGTPFSILNRLASLSQRKILVDLVTYPIGSDPGVEGVTIHRSARIPGIRCVPIGFSFRKLVLDFFLLVKTIQLLRKNRYDLIHTHEEAGLVGNWLARRFRTRHIYDMHSNLLEQLRKNLLFCCGPLRWLGEALQRRTLRHADAVITICPELFAYVQRVAPDVSCVLIENIYDAFSERNDKADPEALRERFQLGSGQVLLYTGTFEPYQGLELIVEAAPSIVERHPRSRFVMVGGTPSQVRRIRSLAVATGVGDAFVFTGTVPAQEIPGFIGLADVLLSPRRRGSNTPSKIYTYLRSGKPIVATNLETHTQVLNPEVAVLTANRSDVFAAGINELLSDDARRHAIGERARQFAAEKYDVSIYHQGLERIYATVFAGHPEPDRPRTSSPPAS